jgi:DNA-binding transcriptional MerR regulator
MSGRSYLSIGDVLTLLRAEFPDITISKIRFLESQGLVNPERSPSGYRKFYDHDVERLRWVLRQQREHFLPLKVIRDRLATEHDGSVPEGEILDAGVEVFEEEVSIEVMGVVGNGFAATTQPEPVEAVVVAGELRRDAGRMEAAGPPARAHAETAPPGREEHPGERPAQAAVPTPPPARPSGAPRGEPAAPTRDEPTPTPPAPADPPVGLDLPDGGANLTLDELCVASGLSEADVVSIEHFGLIEGSSVAGARYYGEEAVTVACLVAEFARFGIETRHLRPYRNAVDREVGLIEQVVAPLLRQRNPEARQRALDAATELARLGESLHAALLRRELQRQLRA